MMEIFHEELSPIPCSGHYYVGTELTFEPRSLFHHLLRARKAAAFERGCKPYDVATTTDLLKLHFGRPCTVEFLEHISGAVGFSKLNILNDGTWWVTIMSEFCSENGLHPNVPLKKKRSLPAWMVQESDKQPRKAPAKMPGSNTRAAALKRLKEDSLFKL